MPNPINTNVFDSRDLVEYREELENDLVDFYNEYLIDHNINVEENEQMDEVDSIDEVELELEGFNERFNAEIEEYEEIKEFCDELEDNSSDFKYGATIIHENYFTEYCEDFLDDCGYLDRNMPYFIRNNIDFEGIADDMKQDYAEVEYQGDTYFIR